MRWKTPPCLARPGTPLNAAPNSSDVPNISMADPAEQPAQRYSLLRAAGTAHVSAATGIPIKIGIAQRLCSVPARVAGALGGGPSIPSGLGADGGKPATGSVTKNPEPISPEPAPKMSAGTTGGPMIWLGLCARPAAPVQ